MKKIVLSVIAILFAGTSLMANVPVHPKRVKQATCNTCTKEKCTKKADCPNTAMCVCK